MNFLNNQDWKKQASAVLADKEAEVAFMKMSMKAVEEKAAPILGSNYFLGFETVYANNKKDKMIGIFGCRLGKQLVYIPVFFINGSIKNPDLLYLQKEKQFVLLSPEWCDYLIGKYVINQGRSIPGGLSNSATQEFDLRWLAYPPTMMKNASERIPLGHTFGFYDGEVSEEDSKKAFDTYFNKQASVEDKKVLKRFIDANGFDAFQKIASAVYNDYEFANNLISLVDEEDWFRQDFIDSANANLKVASEEPKEVLDPIASATNCILVHKGKFNANAKVASEQIEQGVTIEDRRDSSKFDVVYNAEHEDYKTFDNFNAGVYNVLGADGTTRDFVVFTGKSDNDKQPVLMVETTNKGILYAKNVNLDDDDVVGISSSEFHSSSVDLDDLYNTMMAKPLGESYKDYVTEKPEVGKVYGIFSHYNNYISDECFKIIDHEKDEDVDVYTVVPFVYYNYAFEDAFDKLRNSFTIRVNPDALRSNIESRLFKADEIEWVEIPVKESQEVDEESTNAEGNMGISPKKYTVVYSDFTPASIEDYTMGINYNGFNKSEIYKATDDKYFIELTGVVDIKDPLNKTAATVKLMHDLNISQEDAKDLLKQASEKGKVQFFHKKIATRMVLRPEPTFYESLDSDLGINVFENDTKVVPIESDSDYAPDPRYGDHIPLANVENKSSEGKPTEAVNKGSDNDGENDILMTATPNMLAQIAEKTGNKDIFEHGIIGTYAKTYNAASYVSAFLPDLRQGLDKLGRLLFLYLWKPADFSIYYGSDDLLELEAQLSSTFRQFGELVLDLSLRTNEESINNSASSVE